MRAAVYPVIDAVPANEWNALAGDSPFLRHEFLAALEHTHCVGEGTGWYPAHVAVRDGKTLVGAAPAYLKTHSYGEFVFDFAWAQAYSRSGLEYYPKLVVAVPFTPASGARLLVHEHHPPLEVRHAIVTALHAQERASACSSTHALFVQEADRDAFQALGWLTRRDCQFHWSNRGYASFDDYLATFTADKRKKAKRERRRVADTGLRFETWTGDALDRTRLDRVYALHRDTFLRHGHEPYLTRAFFDEICRTMGDALVVKAAMLAGEAVACAIFFRSRDTLYGRYWGAAAELHSLHFETCYHQGIEYCIEQGLARFEPGTQGEHKVSRGFEPAYTWSAHHVADERFRAAIGEYLSREGLAVEAYADEIREHVPFR